MNHLTPEVQAAIDYYMSKEHEAGGWQKPWIEKGVTIALACESLAAEVERLRDFVRAIFINERKNVEKEFLPNHDRIAFREIFGRDFTGELTEEVLKLIYGRYWR